MRTSQFTYDGLSRLAKVVEKQGSTVKSTRKIVWCGTDMLEFRDATDAVTGRVYRNGEMIGTTGYTFMRDHLGSIKELIKTDGKTLGIRLDYDPYGRQTTVSGTAAADFGFTGLYRHAASGLNFAIYRAYDPDLGRWINRDPIAEKGGINLYGYVSNNAANFVDSSGLWQAKVGGGYFGAIYLSFGKNSGKWNFEFGLGAGLGGLIEGTWEDTGLRSTECFNKAFEFGLAGSFSDRMGLVGAGVDVDAGVRIFEDESARHSQAFLGLDGNLGSATPKWLSINGGIEGGLVARPGNGSMWGCIVFSDSLARVISV